MNTMAATGECDPIAPLQDHWLTRQEAILRDCLDQMPELAGLAPKVNGLRIGIGLPLASENWDLAPLLGQDINTLGFFERTENDGILFAMTAEGSSFDIEKSDVVLTARRDLMSLCIHVLRELAALSATHLKTGVSHPALRDLLNQQLLAIRCQAEITEIAVNDLQTDGPELLSAIDDLVQSYLQWAAQVDQLDPNWIEFARGIGRHVGTPWLLIDSITSNQKY